MTITITTQIGSVNQAAVDGTPGGGNDAYLLENNTDGYELESGTGVYLMESAT